MESCEVRSEVVKELLDSIKDFRSLLRRIREEEIEEVQQMREVFKSPPKINIDHINGTPLT